MQEAKKAAVVWCVSCQDSRVKEGNEEKESKI